LAQTSILCLSHGYHRRFQGFYRLIAKTFPFFIYYRIENATIYVDAVLDQRKDPASIKNLLSRLKNES